MRNSRSTSILEIWKRLRTKSVAGIVLLVLFFLPDQGFGKIYLDINAPSIQRIKIAIPDFKNASASGEYPEMARSLPEVMARDLDLSGYFTPMEREAFLEANEGEGGSEGIRFRDWSVIGADLLFKARYTCTGRSLEVDARLYDVFRARPILGKRYLGKTTEARYLMHRISNDIIYALTGYEGMFLSKLAFVGTATGQKEIYVCDYDGHNVKKITHDRSISLFPRWSPKGDRLLFNSYKEGGAMLYMKDMASGKVNRISGRKGLNIGASWAPDGRKMALTLSLGKNPDIYAAR